MKSSDDQYQANITLLGCWDTVGSLGIPKFFSYSLIDKIINKKYRFHNTTINSKIQNALHAVAIDEKRKVFDVSPMQISKHSSEETLRQVWFPGDHGCVGGGKANKDNKSESSEPNPFAQVTLKWMIDSIKDLGLGLEFDEKLIGNIPSYENLPEKFPFENESKTFLDQITERLGRKERSIEEQFKLDQENNSFHESVKFRRDKYSYYKPKNLDFTDQALLNEELDS